MKRTVWRRIDPVHCLNPCGKPNDCFGFVKSPRFQRNRQSFRIRAGRVGRSNGQRDTERGGGSPARQFYEAAVDDSLRSPRISEILPSSDIPLFATAAIRPGAGAGRNLVLPPEPVRFLPATFSGRELGKNTWDDSVLRGRSTLPKQSRPVCFREIRSPKKARRRGAPLKYWSLRLTTLAAVGLSPSDAEFFTQYTLLA